MTAIATQVQAARVSSVNGRLVEANPSRRRSTIAIVLMTGETAATWITSIVVKASLYS